MAATGIVNRPPPHHAGALNLSAMPAFLHQSVTRRLVAPACGPCRSMSKTSRGRAADISSSRLSNSRRVGASPPGRFPSCSMRALICWTSWAQPYSCQKPSSTDLVALVSLDMFFRIFPASALSRRCSAFAGLLYSTGRRPSSRTCCRMDASRAGSAHATCVPPASRRRRRRKELSEAAGCSSPLAFLFVPAGVFVRRRTRRDTGGGSIRGRAHAWRSKVVMFCHDQGPRAKVATDGMITTMMDAPSI